jgi:hypothetical protein
MRVAQPKPPEERILDYLSSGDKDAIKAIEGAIEAIEVALR